MKAFTSIEQSKKLAEFLPLLTADMDYIVHLDGDYSPSVNRWNNEHIIDEGWIPAWSLAALLNILPSATLDTSDDHYCRLRCKQRCTEWHNNPIDTCYEMILKLHEQKIL